MTFTIISSVNKHNSVGFLFTAAQFSLVLQNAFVVLCAGAVYAYLWFESEMKAVGSNWLIPLCHVGIILLAILSNLASLARMIAVERDWIVEICGKDKDMLAGNAMFFFLFTCK